MRRVTVMAAAMAVAVATAGCPDDNGNGNGVSAGSSTSSSTTAVDESTTTTTAGSGSGECPANTNPQAADTVAPRAELTAVRAAHQPGFDRIVFEFRGTAPGFRVEYGNKPVTADGSGDEVPLRGQHALYVRMDNASSWHFDDDDDGVDSSGPSYTGPKRIRPGDTTVVRELVQSGDFEGVLNWAIGTDGKPGFRVRKLSNPPRLMIEICAAP